jgi:hypothetical protein
MLLQIIPPDLEAQMLVKRHATPPHLLADGAAFFVEMVDEYDVCDAGGRAVLTRAAECLDRMAAAQRAIAADGEVVKNQYGMPVLHPATKLEKESRDGFLAAMRMLNLDVDPPRPRPGRPAKIGGYA